MSVAAKKKPLPPPVEIPQDRSHKVMTSFARRKMEELAAENAALRARLGADTPMTPDLWEMIPEDVRDHLAVRVFFEEYGREFNALVRLGFDVPRKPDKTSIAARAALRQRVFGTEGFQRLLRRDLSDVEKHWQAVLARTMNVALNGKDEASVRATQILAKITGKLREDPAPAATTIHLFGLVGGAIAAREPHRVRTIEHDPALESKDPLVLLGHDPGSAQRIDSGDERVYKALETTAEPELDDLNESEEAAPEREGVEPGPVFDNLGIDG